MDKPTYKTKLAVYKYTINRDVDGLDEALMRARAIELGIEAGE